MELPPPLPPPVLPSSPPPASRRRKWPWVLAAGVFLAFFAFGIYVIHRAATGPLVQAFTRQLRQGPGGGAGSGGEDAVSAKDADARRPIVVQPGAGRRVDDARRILAWHQRNVLAAYDRVGRRDSRWDAAARDFLARALPALANVPEAADPATLRPAADALLQAGCDDPAVLLLAGWLHLRVDEESAEANPLLARAVEGFRDTPYPRGAARLAAGIYQEDCQDRIRDGTGKAAAASRLQLAWFEQALADGSYRLDADEQIVLARHLATRTGYGDFFDAERAACIRLLDAAGGDRVAPWVRLYYSGKGHVTDSWEARGGGYANTVSAEGWRGFAREMALARRDLVESWRLNPGRPEAAAFMVSVVMGESDPPEGETERQWFDRATAAQFDYLPAYDKMLWALRPRWGGSERAMLEFGAACADTARFDTAVPAVLAQAARDVGGERENWEKSFNDPLVASRFDTVYAGYAAAPGLSAARRREWAGERVLCAYYQNRSAEAYRWLGELDHQIAPTVCERWRERDARRVTDHLAIKNSSANDRLHPAEQAVAAGQRERAVELYRAVLADPVAGAEPRVAGYCRGKVAALDLSLRLNATVPPSPKGDGWEPFLPAPAVPGEPAAELPGWQVKLGRWEVQPDGALLGRSGARGMMLVSDAAVGPDWEWRGEIEPVTTTNGAWQAGVVFGSPEWVSKGQQWRSVRLKRNAREGDVVTVGQTFSNGPLVPVKLAARNHLVVQSWRGRVNVFLNGQPVTSAPAPAAGKNGWVDRPDARVGFGGYADDNRCEVRFRGVQLRRLHAEPVPPSTGEVAGRGQVSR